AMVSRRDTKTHRNCRSGSAPCAARVDLFDGLCERWCLRLVCVRPLRPWATRDAGEEAACADRGGADWNHLRHRDFRLRAELRCEGGPYLSAHDDREARIRLRYSALLLGNAGPLPFCAQLWDWHRSRELSLLKRADSHPGIDGSDRNCHVRGASIQERATV